MDINGYLDLITSEHRDKPNFTAMVAKDVEPGVTVQDLLLAMQSTVFDLDLAIGVQLDVIGQWVGVSRNVSIQVTGIYFSWDADASIGWDFGSWQDALEPTTITTLPDDTYRVLIKAKIAANHWDGTTTGMYEIWDAIFTAYTILVQDNQNMSYDLIIVGGIVDSLTLALLTGGYIPLKPEGVRISSYIVPVDDGPIFAWDLETEFLAGWDDGSWGRILTGT